MARKHNTKGTRMPLVKRTQRQRTNRHNNDQDMSNRPTILYDVHPVTGRLMPRVVNEGTPPYGHIMRDKPRPTVMPDGTIAVRGGGWKRVPAEGYEHKVAAGSTLSRGQKNDPKNMAPRGKAGQKQ